MCKPKVCVIIPTLNEEGIIEKVLQEVRKHADEIVVIDGHSMDKTAEIAQKLGVKVLLQNGVGKGAALREAFSQVDGDIVVMMDGDGSMKPDEIPLFLEALASDVDVVKGSRFMPRGHSEDLDLIRTIGNRIFILLVNLLYSTSYTDLCYGFAAFKKRAINKLYPYLESTRFEIEAEISIKLRKLGLKVIEVPSVELRRLHGESNLNTIRDGVRIFRLIFHEFFRTFQESLQQNAARKNS